MRFKNYNSGYQIVSLALDASARDDITKRNLNQIYVDAENGAIILLPFYTVLSTNAADIDEIKKYNNFDVFELWENGLLARVYNDKSEDNYFFITGKCNSNCIMCPSPEHSRKHSMSANLSKLLELAKHIPSDVPHLTITGGEPFMLGKQLFVFLQFLKEKFLDTEFLILTNGRIFAIQEYVDLLCETVPSNTVVAIPMHGSCEQVHDLIAGAPGSFRQTLLGVKRLLNKKIPVELRLVINRLNIDDFDNIAWMIIRQLKEVQYVSIIAMEMTGAARVNQEKIWISYKQSFDYIANGVHTLIENGIDVRLYNFPICTVARPFWTLCKKSISDTKVKFADGCAACRYKASCSGVFAGTMQFEKDELGPIL